MSRYRLVRPPATWPDTLPFKLSFPDGDYGVGEEFDHEFDSADDEQANLTSGLLEIVPRKYRNITEDTQVHETAPGEEFEAALTMGAEAHLIDGGFIERVDEPAPAEKKKPAGKKKAEAAE